jgi:hypothetical protein
MATTAKKIFPTYRANQSIKTEIFYEDLEPVSITAIKA